MIATMVKTQAISTAAQGTPKPVSGCIRRSAAAVAVAFLMLSPGIPAPAQQPVSGADLVVARAVIDMHRNPGADSDVVSQALYGTDVVALKQQAGWDDIRTADGYTGWVAAADVVPLHGSPYAPEGKMVRVAALSANVYREPDVTLHAPLLHLPWEAKLETQAAGGTGRWIQVQLVDGQTGWVQRGDVSTSAAPLDVDEMLQLARRFLGVTYTWGGVSSFGFDCSGFTQMLERQRGIEMPRDADLQAAWSGVVAVKRENLKPGDLLFFGSSAARITHTGMYIGNGEFIHDTTHDHPGVQISRLDDMPWTTLLVAARRVK